MTRKKKRKTAVAAPRSAPEPDARDRALAETRSADAATVAWTLAALCTLGALAFRWIVLLIISTAKDPQSLPPATPAVPPLMHFTALISGILAISATPLVYWLRRAAPPWPITAAIVAIGLAPLLLLALNW